MEEAILKKVNLITRDFTSDWVEPFEKVLELILVVSQVTMDIAVGQASGGPLAQGAEECRCPPGGSQYLAWVDWPLILEMMNITLTADQYSNYDLNQKPSCLQVTAASLASSVPPGITGIYGTGGEFQDVFFSNQNWHFSPCQFWKEDAFLILAFLSNQDTRIYKMIQYHCYRMSQLKSVFGYQWLFLYFWKYKYEKHHPGRWVPLVAVFRALVMGTRRVVVRFLNSSTLVFFQPGLNHFKLSEYMWYRLVFNLRQQVELALIAFVALAGWDKTAVKGVSWQRQCKAMLNMHDDYLGA